MVDTFFRCPCCVKEFDDKTEAEKHEQIPLTELPIGFLYLSESQYKGNKYGQIVRSRAGITFEHDVQYKEFYLVFNSFGGLNISPLYNAMGASQVRESVGEKSRLATTEEVQEILGSPNVIKMLRREGLTKLVLNLEGTEEVELPD